MTDSASRKQARRFFGAMGAVMRRTSRWLDARSEIRADSVIRRVNNVRELRFEVRAWRGS